MKDEPIIIIEGLGPIYGPPDQAILRIANYIQTLKNEMEGLKKRVESLESRPPPAAKYI